MKDSEWVIKEHLLCFLKVWLNGVFFCGRISNSPLTHNRLPPLRNFAACVELVTLDYSRLYKRNTSSHYSFRLHVFKPQVEAVSGSHFADIIGSILSGRTVNRRHEIGLRCDDLRK